LDAIEASVESKPPRAYTPPNLKDFAAKGVDRASLRVTRADGKTMTFIAGDVTLR